MKHATKLFLAALALMLFAATGYAQLTITKSDLDASIINKRWIQYDKSDSGVTLRNLGDASSGQTWDFSGIGFFRDTTVRKDTQNYVTPAGHLGASNFPTATVCVEARQTSMSGPYTFTLTFAGYYASTNDGAYSLGYVYRQQVSPAPPPGYPADTTVVVHSVELGFPIPLTNNGSVRNVTDTTHDPGGSYQVRQKSFTMAGEGTLTIPTPTGNRSVQAVRVVKTQTKWEYNALGVLQHEQKTVTVTFIAKDFVQLEVDADSTYTSGSSHVHGWNLTLPSGAAAGVALTSNAVPDQYNLAQNYPNPFNPATTIKFDIQKEGFVSLVVYNMVGQQVAVLANGRFAPGSYNATFDANGLPSGMYMYRLTTDGFVQSKSMLLIK